MRRPFFLYVDEFQTFTTLAFVNMFSELRKMGIAITDALIDGNIDKETFEIRKTALFGERRTLRDALGEPDPAGRISDRVVEYLGRRNMAYLGYESAFPEEKREILRELTSDWVARGKTLEITMRNAFQAVLEWRISQDSEPYRDSTRIPGVSLDGASKSDAICALVAALGKEERPPKDAIGSP